MLSIQQKLSNSFYALLSLPATSAGFALSIRISALSWLLSTKYGLAIDEIGLVWAAGPIAGIFGQVIFGGVRRQYLVLGWQTQAVHCFGHIGCTEFAGDAQPRHHLQRPGY